MHFVVICLFARYTCLASFKLYIDRITDLSSKQSKFICTYYLDIYVFIDEDRNLWHTQYLTLGGLLIVFESMIPPAWNDESDPMENQDEFD